MARAAVARAAALVGVPAPAGAASPARYPCGKLKPDTSPTLVKRAFDSAVQHAKNPMMGTPLGWLVFDDQLSATQFWAGCEYALLRHAYDRLQGLPRRSAKSIGFDESLGGEWADDPEAAGRVRCRFDALRSALGTDVRRVTKAISLLDDTCVDLQMPAWADRALLREALDKVAKHLRLDGKRAA